MVVAATVVVMGQRAQLWENRHDLLIMQIGTIGTEDGEGTVMATRTSLEWMWNGHVGSVATRAPPARHLHLNHSRHHHHHSRRPITINVDLYSCGPRYHQDFRLE